jgi:hypothetical protein
MVDWVGRRREGGGEGRGGEHSRWQVQDRTKYRTGYNIPRSLTLTLTLTLTITFSQQRQKGKARPALRHCDTATLRGAGAASATAAAAAAATAAGPDETRSVGARQNEWRRR